MPTMADLLERFHEFDPDTAQVLLGDCPSYRRGRAELVALVKERVQESGNAALIAQLPALDEAHEEYRRDPKWVGGPGWVRLNGALRTFFEALGLPFFDPLDLSFE